VALLLRNSGHTSYGPTSLYARDVLAEARLLGVPTA